MTRGDEVICPVLHAPQANHQMPVIQLTLRCSAESSYRLVRILLPYTLLLKGYLLTNTNSIGWAIRLWVGSSGSLSTAWMLTGINGQWQHKYVHQTRTYWKWQINTKRSVRFIRDCMGSHKGCVTLCDYHWWLHQKIVIFLAVQHANLYNWLLCRMCDLRKNGQLTWADKITSWRNAGLS